MSWTVSDRFPSWGESGSSPADGFFYEGGDQVNEKHLDYLWNSIRGLEDDVQAALNDIDSDSDGVVDAADTANALNSTEVGDGLNGGDGTALSVDVSDFAGENLTDDGSENIKIVDNPQISQLHFDDSDNDGAQWQIYEESTNGHLEFSSSGGGGTIMDLEHDGTLRIEGELTESASL